MVLRLRRDPQNQKGRMVSGKTSQLSLVLHSSCLLPGEQMYWLVSSVCCLESRRYTGWRPHNLCGIIFDFIQKQPGNHG